MDPPPNLTLTFAALADDMRRSMIHALAHGGTMSGSELGQRLNVDSRSIARHLQILERAGLVERLASGRTSRFRLCYKPLQAATAWLARQENLYVQALDELDRRLSETVESEHGVFLRRDAGG